MPNDGIRLKIILIIEVRKLEFTDFDSHSLFILGYQPWSYFRFIGEGHYVSFIPKTGMLKNNLLHQMIRR